ncbi:hypothetical protein EIP86_006092 [Pleurotus ostreatoroseus]|nr:hypothetical protein EIP86_006092 [Pleurotus ostreatoroseus]
MELKKPVLLLNVGPTRADPVPGVEKIELSSRDVMREAVRGVLGSRVHEGFAVEKMLQSGIIKPPTEDE